jgi:diguanylate cyclase (GGDEF)-like protein
MKSGLLQSRFKNEEDRLTASLLAKFIGATFFTYVIVILAGALWADWNLITITLIGVFSLFLPVALLAAGHLKSSSIYIVLSILIITTIIAIMGEGIHDLAILTYPVLMVLAGLVMDRISFFISSVLALASLGFLIFGEQFNLIKPIPVDVPGTADFIVVMAIWLVAVLAVDLLSGSIRSSFHKARLEISTHKSIESQLRHQKNHDVLTGIYNRAFFEEELARMQSFSNYPISFIVADVDNLKKLNDFHEHAAGDEVLKNTAMILGSVSRVGDILARLGGDEFAILLPGADEEAVEQIRKRIYARLIEFNGVSGSIPVQISIGLATASSGPLKEALIKADQCMYKEKARRKAEAQGTLRSLASQESKVA